MKFEYLKKYFGLLALATAIIAVWKLFDNIPLIFSALGSFCKLLMPFFISFAISYLLFPLCRKIETLMKKSKLAYIKKNRRGLAVASSYVAVIAFFAIIVSFIVPVAAKNFSDFIAYLPTLAKNLLTTAQNFDFYGLNFDALVKNISLENIFSHFELTNINKYAAGVMGLSNLFVNIFMGIVISVYILLDRHNLKMTAVRILKLVLSSSAFEGAKNYARLINTFVYNYIICQLADALIIFALMLIVFLVMKVPYAPALAALIGICNLIPYFGALIAGVVTVVTTLFTAPFAKAVAVAAAVLIVQQIDGNIINPALVKDKLSIKPFWVILGILVGGAFFGVLGIFFAAPIMAFLKIVINDFLTAKENKCVLKPQNTENE